ncbi:hypothetical protein BU16DRAFT_555523 [Lophium mytilinum]|uniref:Uncharacterized protein n=1 Tax=Lophium mytilinum TaxID=390894 RepID=A0A6A6RC50_9PEZI|nr:hypothetical protein BU16DRAFT_555523 [Lophium mytilinum]
MPPRIAGHDRRPSRAYPEPVEEYEEEFGEHPGPNERLAQANQYLATEDIHSSRQFKRRLDLIERFILRKYPAEGLAFDRRLYNQVKTRVEGHKRQIRSLERAEPVAVHPGQLSETSESDSSSDEEMGRYRGLAREPEGFVSEPQHQAAVSTSAVVSGRRPSSAASKPKQPQGGPTRPRGGRREDVGIRTKLWEYGRDKDAPNEPEIWHADMPAILPFGETIYMAKVESDWIDKDLRRNGAGSRADPTANKGKGKGKATEAASASAKGKDRTRSTDLEKGNLITTSAPETKRPFPSLYDSGSSFKLPVLGGTQFSNLKEFVKENKKLFDLGPAIREFNRDKSRGGTDYKAGTYASRKALPKFDELGANLQKLRSGSSSSKRASAGSASQSKRKASLAPEGPHKKPRRGSVVY